MKSNDLLPKFQVGDNVLIKSDTCADYGYFLGLSGKIANVGCRHRVGNKSIRRYSVECPDRIGFQPYVYEPDLIKA